MLRRQRKSLDTISSKLSELVRSSTPVTLDWKIDPRTKYCTYSGGLLYSNFSGTKLPASSLTKG